MRPDHQFPACSVTKLVTVTAVLRLAADDCVRLDGPANDYLRTVRLADGAVTIRDLLTHTGGVDSPAQILADAVPGLATVTGPVVGCTGQRGAFRYSNGGYGALGQMIADVTGSPYPQAAARLVLDPLGLSSSFFPDSWHRRPVDHCRRPDTVRGGVAFIAPGGAGPGGAQPASPPCTGDGTHRPRLAPEPWRRSRRAPGRHPWRLGIPGHGRGRRPGLCGLRQPPGAHGTRRRPGIAGPGLTADASSDASIEYANR